MTKPLLRYDWTTEQTHQLMTGPLESLLSHAKSIHEQWAETSIQKCKLVSIKTGACPEDCKYCTQSAHYKTTVDPEGLMDPAPVIAAAKEAKEQGAERLCMGAAWRSVPTDKRFDQLLETIRGVAKYDLEVCCTFGMATEEQVKKMKEAGLTAYNHNLDTSRDYYPKIISTRTYDDRLDTLKAVRKAGVQICSGGILGLGESTVDRAAMLAELATIEPHPESVPINLLVPSKGTPLEKQNPVPFEEFLRTVATARILMPHSRVRLSAGRNQLTQEQQVECFEHGANSIFVGDKLLTAPNVEEDSDTALLSAYDEHRKSASPEASL